VCLHRLSCHCEAAQIAALVGIETAQQLTASDIAIALLALWVSRLSGQTAFCSGFIFMRRMGSAALCATGPVINVLPVAMRVNPDITLTELAVSLRHELKTVRRHQRYDAEQISRDLGLAGDVQPLYGTVFNFKMFDYHLDFNGVAGITHDLVSGPVRDLEISLHIAEDGALTVDLLANAERYDRDELHAHLQRLPLLLRQFAQDATLKVGAADLLSDADHKLLEMVNATGHDVVKSTLSQQLAQQAERTPHAPALADQHHQFSYTQTRQQVAALAQQLIQQGVQRGDIVAVALGVPFTDADGDCRGRRSLPAA
jgi:enterobactin synthetase component F